MFSNNYITFLTVGTSNLVVTETNAAIGCNAPSSDLI